MPTPKTSAPFTLAEAEARYLSKTIRTSYGTGPYTVTAVEGPCNCPPMDFSGSASGEPSDWHVHLTCRQHGDKQDSFLNGYRLDGTNVASDDTIAEEPADSFLADNPDGPTPPARVLVKVGDDYYPARLSPGYELIGDWRQSPEFDRLVSSAIRDGRFQQRVLGKLVKNPDTGFDEFELEDGRHRLWAAEIAGLHSIEGDLTVMPFHELAVRSLCERNHLTKGARAYTVWPLLATHVEANKEARKARLIPGARQKKEKGEPLETALSAVSREMTVEELAEREFPEAETKALEKLAADYGIGDTLLKQARRVHEIFARRKDLKAENESRILKGELGLGAFLAGMAGKEATEGKERAKTSAADLLRRSFRDLTIRFAPERWTEIPEPERPTVAGELIETILTMPADVQAKLKLALN